MKMQESTLFPTQTKLWNASVVVAYDLLCCVCAINGSEWMWVEPAWGWQKRRFHNKQTQTTATTTNNKQQQQQQPNNNNNKQTNNKQQQATTTNQPTNLTNIGQGKHELIFDQLSRIQRSAARQANNWIASRVNWCLHASLDNCMARFATHNVIHIPDGVEDGQKSCLESVAEHDVFTTRFYSTRTAIKIFYER